MYQRAIEIRKCKACGKSYEQQMGTLAIKSHSFNTCPYCGGSTEPDQKKNEERRDTVGKEPAVFLLGENMVYIRAAPLGVIFLL